MGDDDLLDAGRHRRVDHREDLVAPQVARGEHHVVARDHPEHRVRLGEQPAGSSTTRTGRGRTPPRAARARSAPTRAPWRLVGALVLALVERADRRQPHDARALAGGDLHRGRFSPPTAWLRVIEPSAGTPPTAALTTAARSAVEV